MSARGGMFSAYPPAIDINRPANSQGIWILPIASLHGIECTWFRIGTPVRAIPLDIFEQEQSDAKGAVEEDDIPCANEYKSPNKTILNSAIHRLCAFTTGVIICGGRRRQSIRVDD
jgi:hypothetical protein